MTRRDRVPTTKISAVASDIDGTLVSGEKVLTARARAAVAELHANGIIFTIISSRPPRGVRALVETLEIVEPIGCFNGAVFFAKPLHERLPPGSP